MRGILFIWICMIPCISTAFGQGAIHPKISEVFGSEADRWQVEMPSLLKFYEHLLTERISYIEQREEPGEKYRKLSTIELENKINANIQRDLEFNTDTFNPLKYRMDFSSRHTQVYRVDGTTFLIIIKGQ